MATVRYIVDDVEAAVAFYSDRLGFQLEQRHGTAMAVMIRGDLELWLAGPPSSAAKRMPDGSKPAPGGWARIVIVVGRLAPMVARLKSEGVRCRNDIVSGPGGSQVLIEDPSGNPIELFEPR